jgi:hypothetical protein
MAEELFDLEQAEKLLPRLECLLRNAVESRRRIEEIEQQYASLVKDIFLSGGLSVDVLTYSQRKQDKEEGERTLGQAMKEIEQLGCVVKDLGIGLIDFPCRVGDRDAYLCWRLGEPSIRFWHTTDEGFAGRKPIDESFLAQLKRPRPV